MALSDLERAMLAELKVLNATMKSIADLMGVDGVRVVPPLEPPMRMVLPEFPPTKTQNVP